MIIKYKKGPAKKRGNSVTLSKKLLDQKRESKESDIKLKIGRFKG